MPPARRGSSSSPAWSAGSPIRTATRWGSRSATSRSWSACASTPEPGGHPILVPWAEVDYATRAGVTIGGGLDVLRLDTGTGAVRAIPQIRLEATHRRRLRPGRSTSSRHGPDPVRIGARRLSGSTTCRVPQFALTLHDVDVSTVGPSHHHDLIDLSSPDAALDAADDLIDTAIADALAGLGAAGDLLRRCSGSTRRPVSATSPSPISSPTRSGRSAGYYEELLATPAAMNEVLAALRALITGEPAVALPGTGDVASPWRMVLLTTAGAELGIAVWRAGGSSRRGARRRRVDAGARRPRGRGGAAHGVARREPGDRQRRSGVARIGLVPTATGGRRHGGTRPRARPTGIRECRRRRVVARRDRTGGARRRATGWPRAVRQSRRRGRAAWPTSPVRRCGSRCRCRRFDADGTLTWTPDWDDIEQILARLLSAAGRARDRRRARPARMERPPRVQPSARTCRSSALIADPAVAIAAWATAIALDCRHLRFAFGVLASVLSGGSITAPFGLGRVDLPWRAPVAGEPRAPAVVAWTTPPCPPVPVTSGGAFDLLDGVEGIADPAAVGLRCSPPHSDGRRSRFPSSATCCSPANTSATGSINSSPGGPGPMG